MRDLEGSLQAVVVPFTCFPCPSVWGYVLRSRVRLAWAYSSNAVCVPTVHMWMFRVVWRTTNQADGFHLDGVKIFEHRRNIPTCLVDYWNALEYQVVYHLPLGTLSHAGFEATMFMWLVQLRFWLMVSDSAMVYHCNGNQSERIGAINRGQVIHDCFEWQSKHKRPNNQFLSQFLMFLCSDLSG